MSGKVRLTAKGYEKFTGSIGHYDFVDGVSTDILGKADASRLAAIVSLAWEDSGKCAQENANAERERSRQRHTLRTQRKLENKSLSANADEPSKPKTEKQEGLIYDYDEESLAVMADEGGINALREFAAQYDIKGRTVVEIIDRLMAKKPTPAQVEGEGESESEVK